MAEAGAGAQNMSVLIWILFLNTVEVSVKMLCLTFWQEDSLQIGGVLVDFNPITEGKTGTLADYLCKAEEYLDRELAFRIEDRYTQEK